MDATREVFGVRARTQPITLMAPAWSSTRAQASRVAPVVATSSTSRTVLPPSRAPRAT